MEIQTVEISKPNDIDCTYGVIVDSEDADLVSVLVVSFSGTYPPGSLGNPHGHFITRATIHGLAAFDPLCVLIDLRELQYTWGNTLLSVFEHVNRYMRYDDSEPKFPIVVVTSGKCRDAFPFIGDTRWR